MHRIVAHSLNTACRREIYLHHYGCSLKHHELISATIVFTRPCRYVCYSEKLIRRTDDLAQSDLSSVSSLVELELNNNEVCFSGHPVWTALGVHVHLLQLRGELPARLPTTLQYFDFSNNTFDGEKH